MTLQEIFEAIDRLSIGEVEQIKTHILERELSFGS